MTLRGPQRIRRVWVVFALALMAVGGGFACAAAPAAPFQKIDGCTLKPDRWNDGDSFHVITGDAGREIIVRLYFVDTPEAETAYRDRIAEQAAYFGITPAQAVQVAHDAAEFTAHRLAAPFTVWTRWRSALGRSALGRVYGIVLAQGHDLNELLVQNGLARIYGTRTTLPDGRSSREYLAHLAELEQEAKREHRGAWRLPLLRSKTRGAEVVPVAQ